MSVCIVGGPAGRHKLMSPKTLRLRDCIESYEEAETFIRARVYHMIPFSRHEKVLYDVSYFVALGGLHTCIESA